MNWSLHRKIIRKGNTELTYDEKKFTWATYRQTLKKNKQRNNIHAQQTENYWCQLKTTVIMTTATINWILRQLMNKSKDNSVQTSSLLLYMQSRLLETKIETCMIYINLLHLTSSNNTHKTNAHNWYHAEY